MKTYNKPELIIEEVIVEDVIASSSIVDVLFGGNDSGANDTEGAYGAY